MLSWVSPFNKTLLFVACKHLPWLAYLLECSNILQGRSMLLECSFNPVKEGNQSECTGCPRKKATQAFGSCSRTRVPILFKLTMTIVRKMAKMIVTKANSLYVLPHLECVLLRRLHICCFHWTRRSLLKKFGWDHPKTRFDFEKCPE